MDRRLLLIFLLVAAAGVARLSGHALTHRPLRHLPAGKDKRAHRVLPWTNPPAPDSPPHTPPPGRPFFPAAVSHHGAPPTEAALRAAAKASNLVICVLDAARVDHFGAYGYPRPTTPNFDALAKESVLFEQHFSDAPQTRSATASLLTSQYPDTHGLLANSGDQVRGLSPSTPTLEGLLQRAGFVTALYSGNVVASPALGIGDDFATAEYQERASVKTSWDPVAFLIRDLEVPARPGPKPETRFFVYLHVLPPHQPYLAPKRIAGLFAKTRPPTYWQGKFEFPEAVAERAPITAPDSWVTWGNLYDANLRWADAAVGDLVRALRSQGLLDKTLLIVTADHGDAMREHGYGGHCGVPYDEALHIPLLIRFPGERRPVGLVKALTQTIDVMPTVLDLYGIPYPRREVQGRSLVPLLTGEAHAVNDFVFSRANLWDDSCYVIRDAHTTLLLFHGGEPRALYDMDADPWQTHNIVHEQPARAEALASAFRRFARAQRYRPLDFLDPRYRPPKPEHRPATRLSAQTRRQLKALGYVQ